MAVYAVGDLQGCLDPLRRLLDTIGFTDADTLWLTGDLVNRGPQSLECLRFVRGFGDQAITVLGNHDLHLLALAAGRFVGKANPTLQPILHAPDRDELLDWLRHQPLMHRDPALGYVLVHAGIHPAWGLDRAQRLAGEIEAQLRGDGHDDFLQHMYGNLPHSWSDELRGWERLRFITNSFTRMRYCTPSCELDFLHKGPPGSQGDGLVPWFELTRAEPLGMRVIFGHWSTLSLSMTANTIGIDTGCLWGGQLTAIRLDTGQPEAVSLPCPQARAPRE